MLNLGDIFPDFTAETTKGKIRFYDWIGDSWVVLFSHPADYTPVCTTELAKLTTMEKPFAARNVKPLFISCNNVSDHDSWSIDVQDYAGCAGHDFPYPIIADEKRELSVKLGMLDPVEKDKAGLPLTCRAVFIIGPDKKLKLSMLYPATTGRNFTELLRVLDSLQLTEEKKVATPVDWKQGDACMVIPSIKEEEIPSLFPKGVDVRKMPSGRGYMRFTPQP